MATRAVTPPYTLHHGSNPTVQERTDSSIPQWPLARRLAVPDAAALSSDVLCARTARPHSVRHTGRPAHEVEGTIPVEVAIHGGQLNL